MYIVVSYDVVDDRMRAKVAKIMENCGRRIQKSVFECRIDEKKFMKMKMDLEKVIDMDVDSIRYYFLCTRCSNRIEISGFGTVTEDEELVIV